MLGGRNLNLDAVEMIPPNVYIDAPTLSPQVLDELREALFRVNGVQSVRVVDILPGQRRRLQLDALLAAMADPVLAVDGKGEWLLNYRGGSFLIPDVAESAIARCSALARRSSSRCRSARRWSSCSGRAAGCACASWTARAGCAPPMCVRPPLRRLRREGTR